MNYTDTMKENKDFVFLFKKGSYVSGRNCVVYYKKNGTDKNKLGITTGKKIGNAVIRSRCRRIIRQAYRENESEFPRGYNYVIVARENAGKCKSTDISDFFRKRAIPQIKNGGSASKRKGNEPLKVRK